MPSKDLQNSNFVVGENSNIKNVMAAMNDNQRGTVIVVNNQFNVLGVVSDGDIRRALVRGKDILSPVAEVMNLNPVVVQHGKEAQKKVEQIFKDDAVVHMVPIVDKNNKLVDVIVRNPKIRK